MEKETKEQVARKIWLLYFNALLLERGLLTPKEYRAMKLKIENNNQ